MEGQAEPDENHIGLDISVRIPNCPRGRLMYYLDCVSSLLDVDDTHSRLRNYEYSQLLTEMETDTLIGLCSFFAPDKLERRVIFQDENLCGDSLNKFYDNKCIQDKHKSPEYILIQGHSLKVLKVMAYKRKWLSRNWINPMHFYAEKFERIATQRNKPTSLVLGYGTISTTSDKQGSDDEKLFCENSKKTNRCCMIL